MRNKTELVWVAVLLVVIAASVRWFHAEPAPPAPTVAASPSAEAPTVTEYPRSQAPLSRTSFRIEQVTSEADGKRRLYSFFIRGTASGADYDASLAYDGRTTRSSGHLTEAEYRRFFERLEQHGVWKLVDVARTQGSDDHTSIFVQAGDWTNNVTLGPKYTTDRFAATFMREISSGIAGTQLKSLESALAAGG